MELLGQQIGHVRVDALVGRGGMGDVYRGTDLVLGRPVALKVLGSHTRASEESRARFRREARMLARFQHPNVCQVFDLVEGDESDVLVMEYLEGESLRETMERSLPLDRVLEIAGQIAEVLAAAHVERIVHRDLKPENVMLLPDGRVKVLDFGLARLVEGAVPGRPERVHDLSTADTAVEGAVPHGTPTDAAGWSKSDAERLTRVGTFTGTVRYMSPEQAWGQEVGDASDMYSFGVVLRELVTGEPAYGPEGEVVELLQKVRLATFPPLHLADGELVALVDRLNAPEPSHRPSAAEAVQALAALRDRPRRQRLLRRRAAVAVTVAVALALTALATYRLSRPALWLGGAGSQRAVLLPFANATGDPRNDWLGVGLQEMVVRTLTGSLGARLVGASEAAEVARNLKVAPGPELDPGVVGAVAAALGVELVIGGEVRREGNDFVLLFAACRPGEAARRGQVTASSLTDLAGRLVQELALHLDPTAVAIPLEQTYSGDGLANLSYAIGVGVLASDGARRARPYFEVSLDRDPDLGMARLDLSLCEEKLGQPERASELASQALERARAAGNRDVEVASLLRLGSLARARGDFKRADQLLGGALAVARTRGDRNRQVECLNELGRLALARSELDLAAADFVEAVSLAPGRGPFEGKLLLNLGMVEWRQGSTEAAKGRFEAALERARLTADRDLELVTRTNLGMIALERRRLDEAEAAFKATRGLAREIGNREAELVALTNLGTVAFLRRNWPVAEDRYREVLAARVELGDRPGQAKVLNNLGQVLLYEGHDREAEVSWNEALAIRVGLGDAVGEAAVLLNLAGLARERGRLDLARERLLRALALVAGSADRPRHGTVLANLGELDLDRHDQAAARSRLEQARQLKPDLHELLRLEGRLALASGDPVRALPLLLEARDKLGPDWAERDERELESCRQALQ